MQYKGESLMNLKRIGMLSAAAVMIFDVCFMPSRQSETFAASDVSTMTAVDSTYDLIRELEGFSAECRWDNTQWTIGYGTRCPFEHHSNGAYQQQRGGHVITEEQGREICQDLMNYFINTVRSNCAGLSMEQNQFDALISAAYNHGNVNACPLKYYLQGTLTAEQARQQYLNWYVLPGSMYEQGLRNRRKREADIFFGDSTAVPTTVTIAEPAPDNCSEDYAGTYTTLNVTSWLNIRSESTHSLSGAIIGKIYPNETFTVTKADGNIAHVSYNGTVGIVSMAYIQRVPEQTAEVQINEGDVNDDHVVDGRDASAVLSDYSKISAGKTTDFSESQQKAADANKDGVLDARDATTILSFYANQSVGGAVTITEYLANLS